MIETLFQASLDYLSKSPKAEAALAEIASRGTPIVIVHDGEDGYGSNGIHWDPNSANVITSAHQLADDPEIVQGSFGVQSAALGLVHELYHAIDPTAQQELGVFDVDYGNLAERYAVGFEIEVGQQLGEPVRYNHLGNTSIADNPTQHTVNSVYVQESATGSQEVGPTYQHGTTPDELPDYATDYTFGCVDVRSHLPDGRVAGQVKVGDTMSLADEATLEAATGEVSYSEAKKVPGVRVVTESGVSLVCSTTAPIPTPDGLIRAPELLHKFVPVCVEADGKTRLGWERVVEVQDIGTITVQHITVGDKCFWAGEKPGKFILHHNLKQAPGEGDDPWDPWWWRNEPHSATAPHQSAVANTGHVETELVGTAVSADFFILR